MSSKAAHFLPDTRTGKYPLLSLGYSLLQSDLRQRGSQPTDLSVSPSHNHIGTPLQMLVSSSAWVPEASSSQHSSLREVSLAQLALPKIK